MEASMKHKRPYTWFGSVLDREWCKDVSIVNLPVDHIVVVDWVEKIISLSTRPNTILDQGTFYKVVSVRHVQYSPFFDRIFKRPARKFVEVSLIDGFGDAMVFYLTEEAARDYVEVSRVAHKQ